MVDEVVPTFDRVKGVPFPTVLFNVCQSSRHTALSGSGVRAGGVELGNHGRLGVRASLDGCPHSGTSGADDDNVELVVVCGDVVLWSCGVSACHHVLYITSAQNEGSNSAGDPAGQGSKA